MGFVAKSAFWLGIVYSAMPFDSGSPVVLPLAGTPGLAGSSLESLASSVIAGPGHTQDRWRSAVEKAAALCAHNCLGPSPAGLGLIDAPAGKDRAQPSPRLLEERSDRQDGVRPPIANHIRSTDKQA